MKVQRIITFCSCVSIAFSFVPRARHNFCRSSIAILRLETTTAAETIDAVTLVSTLTKDAIEQRGTVEGLEALNFLGEMCSARSSFDFDDRNTRSRMNGSILEPHRNLLPPETTKKFLAQVRKMESNGWLSTNPDSVDGLPSLHLNLVSKGKPIFETAAADEFEQGIQNLLDTVKSPIYDDLLPRIRKRIGSEEIVVSDVFLRRYGQDIVHGSTRNGISAHYDVFSIATSVIAMDNAAASGENGLYTTATSNGKTSNHASLRRFFPLRSGDSVVHSWDILHGVDVAEGVDRCSLIVWFSTKDALMDSDTDENKKVSPWLFEHPDFDTSDVVQFVSGIAKDSAPDEVESAAIDSTSLFLKSAAQGNAFAFTRMGSICEEQSLTQHQIKEARSLLGDFPSVGYLFDDDVPIQQRLARHFWYGGAMEGNPNAQTSLADEAMEEAVAHGDSDLRLFAATLFGLAAQQRGSEHAAESLQRVVGAEAAAAESEEEFLESPVVQTAKVAMVFVD